MKLFRYAILVIAIVGSTVGAKHRTVHVIISNLDLTTLGFSLASSERQDVTGRILKRIGQWAHAAPIKSANDSLSIASARADHGIIAVFKINRFFLMYKSAGYRIGYTNAIIAIFDTANSYARPCFTISRSEVSPEWWGNYTPFENSLTKVLDFMGENYWHARKMGVSKLSGTVDEIVRGSVTDGCGTVSFFRKPVFSDTTIGYNPNAEEIHDFTYLIACKLEETIKRRVVVIDEEEEKAVSGCALQIVHLDLSEEKNTFSLFLKPGAPGIRPFRSSIVFKKRKDWKDNVAFSQVIDDAFSSFSEAYEAYQTNAKIDH